MKETVRSFFVGALALALSVAPVMPIGAQERDRGNQAAEALAAAQRSATAESILAAKEAARGEGFDPAIRAGLLNRMVSLSMDQLAGLAQQGADADLPLALGSVTSDLVYTPVTPCRVFDTRPAAGGPGPIPANGQYNVFVAGAAAPFAAQGGTAGGCGVPIGATSAIINFVTVAPAGAGNIRAWAVANPQPAAPLAAILNYGVVAGLPAIANGVAVPLCNPAATSCAAGDLRLQADTSATNILGDVVGYFRNPQGLGTVPGTIAETVAWSGWVAGPTGDNTYQFLGGFATVTTTAGQRLTAVAEAPFGLATAGNMRIDICTQPAAGGALTNLSGGGYSVHSVPTTKTPFSANGTVVPAAGTWRIGMCGLWGAVAITNSDFVNGWVLRTNP